MSIEMKFGYLIIVLSRSALTI